MKKLNTIATHALNWMAVIGGAYAGYDAVTTLWEINPVTTIVTAISFLMMVLILIDGAIKGR